MDDRHAPPAPQWQDDDQDRVAKEIEYALIGCMMAAPTCVQRVLGICQGDQFIDGYAGSIFDEVCRLVEAGKPVSPHVVRATSPDSLAASPEGVQLMIRAAVASPPISQVEYYAQQVAEGADRREALNTLELASYRLKDAASEPGTTMTALNEVIAAIAQTARGEGAMVDAQVVVDRVLKRLDQPATVYSTGMPRLDRALGGGLVAGKLYGLAARMKHGKTATLGSISFNLAMADNPVPHLYLPLEMGAEEIMQRHIARAAGMNSLRFLDADAPTAMRQHAQDFYEKLKDRGLYFQPSHRMGINSLKSTLIRAALSGKVRGVIIDYLQLVTGQERGRSQADHYDYVVQTIVEVCKEYGLWVLMAAQLNRDGEVRGGDGLLNACDMTLYQHRLPPEAYQDANGTWRYAGGAKDGQALVHGPEQEGLRPYASAWLEMRASRYTRTVDIGKADRPAYRFVDFAGPHIEELMA